MSGSAFALSVDKIEIGCGYSENVYSTIHNRIGEKSQTQVSMEIKDSPENGRRLYIYADHSWFLSLEYFSHDTTDLDVSCIVLKGPGDESEKALGFKCEQLPAWIY